MNRADKRASALDLYLNTDKTQKEICEIVGWTQATFTDNKEKGDWEALKGATTITAANIIKKLYLKLDELTDDKEINADALIKVAKAIEFMSNKKVTGSQLINCFKLFITWLFPKKPELAKEVNKAQMEFLNEFISNG